MTVALLTACILYVGCGDEVTTDPPGGDPPGKDPTSAFVQVASGSAHSCALDDAGVVWCWGRNLEGQLGLGDTEGVDVFTPTAIESEATFVAVGAGDFHTCALDDAGAAWCWGANDRGQIGDGSDDPIDRDVPSLVAEGHVFTELTVGGSHACGIVTPDEGYCWGDNDSGELGGGGGGSNSSSSPVPIVLNMGGASNVRLATIDAGAKHTCAVDELGAGWCWGFNGSGQLGTGDTNPSDIPASVAGGATPDFVSISAGANHTCGTAGSGQADCWGFNFFGQFGDGTNDDAPEPGAPGVQDVLLPLLSAAADHTCGLDDGGVAYCWGFNGGGALGDGTESDRNVPTAVVGGLTFVDVSAGTLHTCGVSTDGDVYCWGVNTEGQLGIGTTDPSSVPVLTAAEATEEG